VIRTSGCSFRASTKNLRRYLVLVLTPGLIEHKLARSLSNYSGIGRGNRLEYVQMIQRSPSANPAALVRVISGKVPFPDAAPRGSGTRECQYSGTAPAGWIVDPGAVDLFLSYNSRDRVAVQQVRTLLGARGVSVFYDRESLGLGLNWFEPLERALRQVHGVVVFLGPNGLGRWQRREMALALDRQTREATFPVIPVLLSESEAGDYSGFLLLNAYADLRGGLNDPDTLDAIIRAVRGPATGEEARTISPPEAATICPYRGLNAFREEDAPLFFGRDRLVDEPEQGLRHKVLTCPLVAVVGASGSGKSSAVRAGLLPRLRREPPSRGTWDAVVFRPEKYPFLKLAMALEAALNPEASDTARKKDAADLSELWSSGKFPLELSLVEAREALRVDRLLVVVDQFEELVTLTPKDDRLPFLSRLLAATGAYHRYSILIKCGVEWLGQNTPGSWDSAPR
jgi:TIR domain